MPESSSPDELQQVWNDAATQLVHAAIADLDTVLEKRDLLPLIGEGRRMTCLVMHNMARLAMSHMSEMQRQGLDISSAYIRRDQPTKQPPSPL